MQVFKQWPLYFIGRILPAAIAFGGIGLYTRLLDPASFGIYALLLSTSYLISLIGYSWLRVATLRMMASSDAADEADYTATIALSFAAFSVPVAVAVIVFLRICEPSLPFSLELLTAAAAIANNWFELNVALVQSRMRLVSYGLLQAGRAVGTLCATLLLIGAGFKAQALLGGFALGNCAALGASGLWSPSVRGRFRLEIFMRMARFGWPSSAGSLSYSITTVQRYLLQVAGGSAAVGVLAAAGDFSVQTVGLLIGTATLAGQPLAFRARDLGRDEHLREQLQNNARLVFAIGFAAAAGVIVLSGSITHVYFGSQFRGGAAAVMAVSAAGVFLSGLRSSYFEQAFEIALDTRPVVVLTLLRIVAALVPSAFLIPRFGAVGAVSSILIAEIVTMTVSAIWAVRLIDMPVPLLSFARIALATAAMSAAIYLVPHRDSPLGLVAAIVVGVLTYGGCLALMHGKELRALWRVQPAALGAASRS